MSGSFADRSSATAVNVSDDAALDLAALLQRPGLGGRWWLRTWPFEHVVADRVFESAFARALTAQFQQLLAAGRFHRNMQYSDALGYDLPPDLEGPLAVFYSRAWHELLCRVTGVAATGDVNGALHHHPVPTSNGSVHRDYNVGWFSDQPRGDGINPMDLARCSYTRGTGVDPDIARHATVRAVTMIFYLANPPWNVGDGGETGLYRAPDDPVERPATRIAPHDNSLLVFENTPWSYHSFLRNTRHQRNSVILWLHRDLRAAAARWPDVAVGTW